MPSHVSRVQPLATRSLPDSHVSRRLALVVAVSLFLAAASPADAHRLTVAGFNVESGGADLKTLAKRVASQKDVDVWGLSEVQGSTWAETLEKAVAETSGNKARAILGTTGGADRLAVIFNESKFDYVRHFELRTAMVKACGQKNARAPLVVDLKHREMGKRFWIMVNHLQRGDKAYRHCQAEMLNTWVKTNTVPMIAVGDYNFDWDIASDGAKRDKGLDLLTADHRFRWVRPSPPLVRTQCAYNSILDFVFVTARAQKWPATSRVAFADEPEYCKAARDKDSDHRPVIGQFEMQ